jgi:TetR/AcrR family transcriptional regulator
MATTAPQISPVTGEESARQRLVDAAAMVFSEHGFAGSSIAAIAEAAMISKSTIFHHFESKQALYRAVIESAAQEFGRQLDSVLSTRDDAGECLRRFQQQHLNHLHSKAPITRLVLRQIEDEGHSEACLDLVREVFAPNFEKLASYLADAQRAGLLRADLQPAVAALVLVSANIFYFQHARVLSQLPGMEAVGDSEGYSRAVIDTVFNGLRVQA